MCPPSNDRAVTHSAVFFDDRGSFARMNHAVVLYAGARADHDRIAALIRAQDRAPPDAGVVADANITDEHCGGRNEGFGRHSRFLALIFDDHSDGFLRTISRHDI